MFGVPHIKVDVIDRFNLQEIRFLGHRTGRGLGIGYIRSHSASLSWSIAASSTCNWIVGGNVAQ
jgi:hypothetical protein